MDELTDLCSTLVPPEILKLKEQRESEGSTDCRSPSYTGMVVLVRNADHDPPSLRAAVNYGEYNLFPAGQVALIGRIKCVL